MSISIEDFQKEVECVYKGERYSVRDNGAVLRHCFEGKRLRPYDNKWTFGKPNGNTGYLEIVCVPVHRIVAVSFHGEPPTKKHVVDHIDTNKRNNRPENLRWVTRLENILLNPITAKRIELICGSVEAFLENPSKFRDKFPDPNFQWMCTVSKEESQASLERLTSWAKSDNRPSGGSLGEWIFNRTSFNRTSLQNKPVEEIPDIPDFIMAKTINAAQRDWRTPSEFPCCPKDISEEPLETYAENLKIDSVFCHNDLYTSLVYNKAISDDRQTLIVMTKFKKELVKSWALAKITFEDGLFVHTSIKSFFTKEGAEKQFTLAQGLDWTGEDSIDDYC